MTDLPPVKNNTETRRFEITLGDEVAFAEYRLEDDVIVLPHTVAPDAFKGLGAGKALAETALGYARAHHLQVVPTCSFMAAYITRHPEWHDIVHPKFRERLGIT
jgi:predicted GNAT family acetyltransferase